MALTDHGSMAALFDAYKASLKSGVKLIPGMEAYVTDDLTGKKNYHLVLLAKNQEGYKNILRLNYEAFKNQSAGYMGKTTPRVGIEHLEKFNEGIIALTACCNGLVAKTLITNQEEDKAIEYMKKFKEIFKSGFYLELQPHKLEHIDKHGKEVNQVKLNEALLKYSRDLDIPYTITCDTHYPSKDRSVTHDLMLATKDKKSVNDPDRFRYGTQEMYLKSEEEIIEFFGKDIAETGINNSFDISLMCDAPVYLKASGPRLPRFKVKEESNYTEFRSWYDKEELEIEEEKAYLRYKCIDGFKNRLKDLDAAEKKVYWERVVHEISVLEEKGFCSYMLIVADYVNWAKNNSIPVGPGRGSGAGSLVGYLMGITDVEPMKHKLIFERFINKEKKDFPDYDIDFGKPALIKEYLKNKYGEDKVASISNWACVSPKVAVKDIARSLEIGGSKSAAFQIANAITTIMPDSETIEDAVRDNKEFAKYMKQYPEIYDNAKFLQGVTRQVSTHAAGVVISEEPLYETTPLRIDAKNDLLVTQWSKDQCSENGLIKMDILGLESLNVIDDSFKMIEQNHNVKLTMHEIPMDDANVYKMISDGDVSGIFQLEDSLAPLCEKIKPTNIDMVADINALGRPSCSAVTRQKYIDGRFGAKTEYTHPKLENSLKKTYGVSLYEECLMTIARDCAGWDLCKADGLRKLTKNKDPNSELTKKTAEDFIKGCVDNGISKNDATHIWENEVMNFSGYGFNSSHAVSYSYISYYTAWLKYYYPTEFMCAILNSKDPNSDKIAKYFRECERLNVELLPPNINSKSGGYSVAGNKKISCGIASIKGVGESAIDNILENQPFSNIQEFLHKTTARTVNKRVIEALAKAGAFKPLLRTRKDIHDNYDSYRTKVNNEIKKGKKLEDILLPEYNDEWERKELLTYEREILGRTISGSMHEVYPNFFKKDNSTVTTLDKVESLPKGQKIKIEVIVNSKLKEFKIKKGLKIGQKFAKYMVEDVYNNTAELTIWSHDYEKYNIMLTNGVPIKAICKVDEYMGTKSLSLANMEFILGKKI
jgi:DNA polymerase-3 subunit alpha